MYPTHPTHLLGGKSTSSRTEGLPRNTTGDFQRTARIMVSFLHPRGRLAISPDPRRDRFSDHTKSRRALYSGGGLYTTLTWKPAPQPPPAGVPGPRHPQGRPEGERRRRPPAHRAPILGFIIDWWINRLYNRRRGIFLVFEYRHCKVFF